MTAGYLGGRVAGSSWEALVQQSRLHPLGMTSTSFAVADMLKLPDHATGYKLDPGFDPESNSRPVRQQLRRRRRRYAHRDGKRGQAD